MGDAVLRSAADPDVWIVVFNPITQSRLIRLLPGRFKHVSALAYLPGFNAWQTFDVGTRHAKVAVIPQNEVSQIIGPWIAGCTLVRMTKNNSGGRWPLAGWCVPAVRHLLGMNSGALRPDTLYRHCLRDGGKIISEPGFQQGRPVRSAARP